MTHEINLTEFLEEFSNDDKCLEEIKNLRFPNGIFCDTCLKITKRYKLDNRKAYSCEFCRSQVHPLAQTIFEHSSTPLTLWFYAIFLMTKTRSGVSARQLHRELGVTYKTAWRMWKQIRMLMVKSGGGMLEGIVEVDETFVGGKGKNRAFKPKILIMSGLILKEESLEFTELYLLNTYSPMLMSLLSDTTIEGKICLELYLDRLRKLSF